MNGANTTRLKPPQEVFSSDQFDLANPTFQDHLALRFLTQVQVADMYRELGRQAEQVLERTEALMRPGAIP